MFGETTLTLNMMLQEVILVCFHVHFCELKIDPLCEEGIPHLSTSNFTNYL